MTATSPRARTAPPSRYAVRLLVTWLASFVAFPLGGILGGALAGPVDGPVAALLGGLVTGAVLGVGQSLASSGRLAPGRWTVASSVGLAVGLLAGAHVVGYDTSTGSLAAMGAVTGVGLGLAQAAALPAAARWRWAWALAVPPLWALGWLVTTAAGVAVDERFTTFGATGAVTVTLLAGLLLQALLPRPRP